MKYVKSFDEFVNEQYDSPEIMGRSTIDSKELRKLSKLDYRNRLEYGFWNNPNNNDLWSYYNDIKEHDKYAILEIIDKKISSTIPEISAFKRRVDVNKFSDHEIAYNYTFDRVVDKVQFMIEFVVRFLFEADELMDRPKGTIKIFLSPNIKPYRNSSSMSDIMKSDDYKSETGSDEVDKISAYMYKRYDKEYTVTLEINEEFTDIAKVPGLINQVKINLKKFSDFCNYQYDVKIFDI